MRLLINWLDMGSFNTLLEMHDSERASDSVLSIAFNTLLEMRVAAIDLGDCYIAVELSILY